MGELPEPLVPSDCDCTDLDGFMLNVERLMASELVALSTHEVVGAALFLWCRAWKQRPAASLPDDERVLAAYARLPLPRFRRLREEVLHGFVKCSDGRLYHRVLTVEALKAYEKKLAFQNKRNGDAERLRKWRRSRAEMQNETPSETRFVAEGQGQGQGQGQGREAVEGAAAATPPADEPALPLAPSPENCAVEAWNEAAERAGWPKVQRLTEPRRKALKARLAEVGGLEGWQGAIAKAEASAFLTGKSGRSGEHANWRCDLDFILRESKFTKLMEGGFDDRSGSSSRQQSSHERQRQALAEWSREGDG